MFFSCSWVVDNIFLVLNIEHILLIIFQSIYIFGVSAIVLVIFFSTRSVDVIFVMFYAIFRPYHKCIAVTATVQLIVQYIMKFMFST